MTAYHRALEVTVLTVSGRAVRHLYADEVEPRHSCEELTVVNAPRLLDVEVLENLRREGFVSTWGDSRGSRTT